MKIRISAGIYIWGSNDELNHTMLKTTGEIT